jgi:hypothetical protein
MKLLRLWAYLNQDHLYRSKFLSGLMFQTVILTSMCFSSLWDVGPSNPGYFGSPKHNFLYFWFVETAEIFAWAFFFYLWAVALTWSFEPLSLMHWGKKWCSMLRSPHFVSLPSKILTLLVLDVFTGTSYLPTGIFLEHEFL